MTQQNSRIKLPGEQLDDVLLAMAREAIEITDDDLRQSTISLISKVGGNPVVQDGFTIELTRLTS